MDNLPPPGFRRPRVLQLAYCCGPELGSEEGLGWNIATEVARRCDTWVICEERNYAPTIMKYLSEHGPIQGLTFVFVPERAWAHYMWAVGLGYVSYNLWHRRALVVARKLHAQHNFDLVHQVNVIGFREPGYLWKLGVPFVWGPVGGMQNCPLRFLAEVGVSAGLAELIRTAVNRFQLQYSPRVRKAARRATALLAANSHSQRKLAQIINSEPILLSEVHAEPSPVSAKKSRTGGWTLRILWSGKFLPIKALSLLLRALADLPEDVQFQLRVVGDGPQRDRWQHLARRLAIDDRIDWVGWRPHKEALAQFSWADVSVFSSLRDTTGTVVVESLSHGTPVICLDHHGAGDLVDETCGIKIPVTNRRQVIADLRDALVFLAGSPDELHKLEQGAVQRAQDYLGRRQGEKVLRVYRDVLTRFVPTSTRNAPNPFIPDSACRITD